MTLTTVRLGKAILALVALAATLAVMALASATPAQAGTSTITRADCEAGRITVNGRTLSRSECLARVGQRVNLSGTGLDAWMIALLGGAALAGGVALRRRPRPMAPRI